MALEIKGDSFAGRYKRVNGYAIDSTDIWDTKNDASAYARNTDTEAYVPYAGQIVAVRENGKCYQLVRDETVTDYPEREHFSLVVIGNANDIDDAYLSRDKEDTAKELIHFMKGIDAHGESKMEDLTTTGTVKSGDYSKGSSGYSIYKDADGNYHLEIYYLDVRGKMNVETIEVKQSYHVKGAQWMTKASLVVSRVDGNKVYFNTRDADGNTITNDFVTGDFAYCKTFNLKDNRMYWRDVTAVGEDYITLGAGITDAIRPGDSIVQLGNGTDTARQGATCLDTDAIKIYMGINTKSLPAPFIDLDPVNGAVIKAKLINAATGTDVSDDIEMLNAKIETVKAQTDKMYVIWFDDYVPTLSNLPASGWKDDAARDEHVQDLFYNTSKNAATGGGRAYRFEKVDGAYTWNGITDKDTIAALEAAARAQDTADGKRRVFVSRPKDSDVYDIGDLWVNATYTGGNASYDNDELVCVTAKASGGAFSISHWKPTSTATTAVIRNLGNQIVQVVSDLGDADEAIAAAGRLANQGISDANNAYRKANDAYSYAGSVDARVSSTNRTVSEQSTVISQTKESIALLAQGKVKNENGTVSELSSGLVTDARFNVLLSKKITFDKDGHVTNIDTSGFVTTSNFATQYAQMEEADGYIKRSEISTFITKNRDGTFTSNALVSADKIRFNGNIIANDSFMVDKQGNVTMNNATVTGKVTATEGKIGGLSIDSGMLKWKSYDYFGKDSRQLQLGASSSDYDGMVDVKFNAATTGKFGVKAIGANAGGAAIYGSTGDMLYPASSMTFAGFFVGPVDVRDTNYGISSDACASKSFRVITSRNSDGTYVYHEGVNWNRTVGSPDLDSIRLIVEGGIITGYYKE